MKTPMRNGDTARVTSRRDLTSAYDPELEAAAAEWIVKIGAFITGVEERAGTLDGTYQSNKQFYEDMQSSISGHIARTRAASGSQTAIEILRFLSKDIENLRKLHESGGAAGLPPVLGEPARQALERELRALSMLESEYKRQAADPGPKAG